jgi:NTP pyrophosphatase (non-canonical NTP hydrolase)
MPPINQISEKDIERLRDHGQLDMYQIAATKSAIYPGIGMPNGLAYVALKLNGEAGEFAEHVGKAMRDDGYGTGFDQTTKLTPERHALLVKEIGDQLWYLSAACNELGITLYDAAIANLEKLADRQKRGKLQGSGDDR